MSRHLSSSSSSSSSLLEDCRLSADSQYVREELDRPDTPGLCERSIYSLAFPFMSRHLSSSSSSSSSLLEDCRLSADSQYVREELDRPDIPGLCERSIYSLAFPFMSRHLSSSSSSSSSLLEVGLLVGSGFGL